jgi:uncharacterized membrane protein YebE (DUF533 family)
MMPRVFSATKLLGGLIDTGGLLGGGPPAAAQASAGGSSVPWGTVAAVAGVAAVGGVAYGAYRHYKAGGFGQGGPGLFGGTPEAAQPPPQAAGFGAGTAAAAGFGGGAPGGFGAQPLQPQGFSPPAFTTAEGAGFGGGAARAHAAAPAPPAAPMAPAAPAAPMAPAAPAAVGHDGSFGPEEQQALLLVRVMIAAANVDGRIDDGERQRILQGAERAGFGAGERAALERELAQPQAPNVLLGQVRDPEMAAQCYLVTLLAVDRDSEVERTYLRALPLVLQLPGEKVAQIHAQLGAPPP